MISALFIALLIVGAFAGAFVRTDLSFTIAGMFICAMLALIVCLLLFLRKSSWRSRPRDTCRGSLFSIG